MYIKQQAMSVIVSTMALSSKVRHILLLENSFLQRRLLTKKKKRIGLHEINKKRGLLGEFHQVYE